MVKVGMTMVYDVKNKDYEEELFNKLYDGAFNLCKNQLMLHKMLGIISVDDVSCNMETPTARVADNILEALVYLMMNSDNKYFKVMGHLINDTSDMNDMEVFNIYVDYTTTLYHEDTSLDSFLDYLFYNYEEEIRDVCKALQIDYDELL